MRNIFELSRNDLWWLEDKFQRFEQLDKEIAIRKEELKIQKTDENVGGGKTNIPSNPVETQVIKEQSDPYITTRQEWKDVGSNNGFSKTSIYDMRYSILERFAEKIGYI